MGARDVVNFLAQGLRAQPEGQVAYKCNNILNAQGRRKVPRSGAAIYRGRAAAENFSSAHSTENFLTYLYFSPTKKQLS